MTIDLPLFTYSRYPDTAGWRDNTTSRDAAIALEASGKAARHRSMVLGWYEAGNTGTADEASHALGISPFSGRPRISEFYKLGKLARTGERRAMDSGAMGHVMRIACPPR